MPTFDTGEVCSPEYELGSQQAFMIIFYLPHEEPLRAKWRGRTVYLKWATLEGTVSWLNIGTAEQAGIGVAYKVEVLGSDGDWHSVAEFDLTCWACGDSMTKEISEDITGILGMDFPGIQLVRITRTDYPIPVTAKTQACLRIRGEYEVV